jgi:enoyl-[acyl-carrier protein] reductase III
MLFSQPAGERGGAGAGCSVKEDPVSAIFDFSGRRALVTGASRGVGAAIAAALGRCGARVYVHYREQEAGAGKTCDEIEASGGSASKIRANLVHPEEIRAMFAEIRKDGALDFLVHSAALGTFKALLDLRTNQWDLSLSVNARSFLLCVQEATSGMASGGRIVAISSLGSGRVLPEYGAIGVSKAALEALTRSLAWELGPRGILVNAVAAGVIDSPTIRHHPHADEILARAAEQTPTGRLGTGEDVARVVLFLLSPLSAWVTGQTLVADGGMSLRV